MTGGRVRVAAAVLAALAVAQAAVLVLQPREGVLAPAPVEARSYFSAAQIERAQAFRRPQVVLGLATLAVEVGLLAWLVARPPRRLRRAFRRPLAAAAGAGVALSLAVTAVTLPLRAIRHERAVDVGLATQTWPAWLGDVARSAGIGAVLAAAGALVAVWLLRRAPRRWWIPAAAVVWGFGWATVTLGPLALDPVFNRFEPLRGPLRADVLALARQAGVDVGEVYVMDASRRTTAANAYVAGLGATKRVVLYDTLVEGFPRDQVRLVVAHELGHVRHDDLRGGLLFLALVAPAGLWAVSRWVRHAAPAGGPAAVPALALAVTVVATGTTWISNQLSRAVEARADATSLALTRDADAFEAFHRRLAVRNLADPDPPGWQVALLGTHPPTVTRLGYAVTFRAGPRAAAGREGRRTPAGS